MYFQEKADSEVLLRCKDFVVKSKEIVNDYQTFRNALYLGIELRKSLIASHKDFDDFLIERIKDIDFLDGIERDVFVIKFNNEKHSLLLDVEAHHVLDELEVIEKRNRRL